MQLQKIIGVISMLLLSCKQADFVVIPGEYAIKGEGFKVALCMNENQNYRQHVDYDDGRTEDQYGKWSIVSYGNVDPQVMMTRFLSLDIDGKLQDRGNGVLLIRDSTLLDGSDGQYSYSLVNVRKCVINKWDGEMRKVTDSILGEPDKDPKCDTAK